MWNPENFIKAADMAKIRYDVDSTWLDVDPYGKSFQPIGLIWHHTACNPFARGNIPTLGWCRNPGVYAGESRMAHAVVGRDGFFQFIAGGGAYHAGLGGPLRVNGIVIPKNIGNRNLIGIEIDASSTNSVVPNRETPKIGMTRAQFEATARFSAALFEIMKWSTSAAIRHKDWAPGRKTDVGIPLEMIRERIDFYRNELQPVKPSPAAPAPAPAVQNEKPIVNIIDLKPRKKNISVAIVQDALEKEVGLVKQTSPIYNAATTKAYQKWQQKCKVDVTEIPDKTSLTKLARKYHFTVK